MSPVPFAVVMMKRFHTCFFTVKYLKSFGGILNHTFLVRPTLVNPLTLKDLICYYINPKDGALEYLINFVILLCKIIYSQT